MYAHNFALGIKPYQNMTVSEWAAKYRVLDAESSAEPGRWRNERTPYLVEIMDCLSADHPCTDVVMMSGSQMGKTECGNNWMGHIIHINPGPTMFLMPTVDTAKDTSKTRIAPMIANTHVLRERVRPPKTKDSGNTILNKSFPGGRLLFRGANSASGLASVPIKYLYEDEVDRYPDDVDGEGDPISLAEKRTLTFSRRKRFKTSTPGLKSNSKILPAYEASDKRRYHIPCPHCDHFQVLTFAGIKFERDDKKKLIKDPVYICESCSKEIEESHKTEFLRRGKWIAECPEVKNTVGFWINGLYSPLGWLSWREIVDEFLLAKSSNSREKLKTWTNTILGEPWEDEAAEFIGWESIKARAEKYKTLPDPVCVLTCAVDVQDNRLEAEVVGWGFGEESWGVEYRTFMGDPTSPSVWRELDAFLMKSYEHESGFRLKINITCIDTGGHHTKQVYDFAKSREHRRIFAIKGSSQEHRPVVSKPSKTNSAGISLFPIGTDTAKETIFYRLRIEAPGPGYMHFPDEYGDEYYRQLTSERLVFEYKKGVLKQSWKKIRARNEALDIRVYNLAALTILNPNFKLVYANLRKGLQSKDRSDIKKKVKQKNNFATRW